MERLARRDDRSAQAGGGVRMIDVQIPRMTVVDVQERDDSVLVFTQAPYPSTHLPSPVAVKKPWSPTGPILDAEGRQWFEQRIYSDGVLARLPQEIRPPDQFLPEEDE